MNTGSWALVVFAAFGIGAFVGNKSHEERWQIARAKDAILWKVNTVTGETYICVGARGCRRVENIGPQTGSGDANWQPPEFEAK